MTNYPVATLAEYGYKDYKNLTKAYKVFSKVAVGIVVFMLYISIIVLAIQSVKLICKCYKL